MNKLLENDSSISKITNRPIVQTSLLFTLPVEMEKHYINFYGLCKYYYFTF